MLPEDELQFYYFALDVLEKALEREQDPARQAYLREHIREVEQRIAAAEKEDS